MLHFNLKKICLNLLVSSVVILALFTSRAYSQQFEFDPSWFEVVKSTAPAYGGNGYEHLGGYTYRLTDSGNAFCYSVVAMWYNKHLDLSEHFHLSFLLNFGNDSLLGSDGLAFVLHKIYPYDNLIGADGGYLGYGGYINSPPISPSFAIEFDIHSDKNVGWDYLGDGHISFQRDGSLTSTLSNSAYIKDNGTVKDGQWYCIDILWLHNDMIVFVNGEERIRKHYSSVSKLISGAFNSLDVTWGITAACGARTAKQEIEFVSLVNGGMPVNKIIVIWEGEQRYYYAYNGGSIYSGCSNVALGTFATSFPDTIRVDTTFCINNHSNNVLINLPGNHNNIAWAIKDTNGNYQSIPTDSTTRILFPIHSYGDSARYNPADMWVRLILDGKDIYFNFKFSDNLQEANK